MKNVHKLLLRKMKGRGHFGDRHTQMGG